MCMLILESKALGYMMYHVGFYMKKMNKSLHMASMPLVLMNVGFSVGNRGEFQLPSIISLNLTCHWYMIKYVFVGI